MITKYDLMLTCVGFVLMMVEFNLGIEIIGHIMFHETLANLIDELTK